jgi:hypothetical protein
MVRQNSPAKKPPLKKAAAAAPAKKAKKSAPKKGPAEAEGETHRAHAHSTLQQPRTLRLPLHAANT